MSQRDALTGVELLLVDGNNLLHREAGGPGAGPVRSLLARLQSAVREPIHTTVVLDGHPAPGSRAVQKVSPRLDLRHAGSRSADDLIIQLAMAHSPVARAGVVVISDDRALRDRARMAGCQGRRLDWLQGLMGSRRPPARAPAGQATAAPGDAAIEEPDEPDGWRPGRGATRKKGNPRRNPRRGHQPRSG